MADSGPIHGIDPYGSPMEKFDGTRLAVAQNIDIVE